MTSSSTPRRRRASRYGAPGMTTLGMTRDRERPCEGHIIDEPDLGEPIEYCRSSGVGNVATLQLDRQLGPRTGASVE